MLAHRQIAVEADDHIAVVPHERIVDALRGSRGGDTRQHRNHGNEQLRAEMRPLQVEADAAEHRSSPAALEAHVRDLTARDVKAAYHKNLQGYLWEDGYASGAYATDLFDDVVPCLKAWRAQGRDVAIYSSGSVFAQKLLMRHVQTGESEDGKKVSENLEGLVSGGWFDTVNAGLKAERGSYVKIAQALEVSSLAVFTLRFVRLGWEYCGADCVF